MKLFHTIFLVTIVFITSCSVLTKSDEKAKVDDNKIQSVLAVSSLFVGSPPAGLLKDMLPSDALEGRENFWADSILGPKLEIRSEDFTLFVQFERKSKEEKSIDSVIYSLPKSFIKADFPDAFFWGESVESSAINAEWIVSDWKYSRSHN